MINIGDKVKFNGGGPSNGRPGKIIEIKVCPQTKELEYVIRWNDGGKSLLPEDMFEVI